MKDRMKERAATKITRQERRGHNNKRWNHEEHPRTTPDSHEQPSEAKQRKVKHMKVQQMKLTQMKVQSPEKFFDAGKILRPCHFEA
jgi:hypothetical protein